MSICSEDGGSTAAAAVAGRHPQPQAPLSRGSGRSHQLQGWLLPAQGLASRWKVARSSEKPPISPCCLPVRTKQYGSIGAKRQ